MPHTRRQLLLTALAASLSLGSQTSLAQTYPERTITIVVAHPPGGASGSSITPRPRRHESRPLQFCFLRRSTLVMAATTPSMFPVLSAATQMRPESRP